MAPIMDTAAARARLDVLRRRLPALDADVRRSLVDLLTALDELDGKGLKMRRQMAEIKALLASLPSKSKDGGTPTTDKALCGDPQ